MKYSGFIVIVLVVLLILGLIFGVSFWTDRTLEFWLSYLKHEPIYVPYWLSLLLTIILNGAALLINIISELIRLVL
jgi:hypothetical protein